MQWGIDHEQDAFAAYEALTGELASPCGFVAHDAWMAGASPDGQIDDWTGLLELKCPLPATHLGYLRGKTIPADYLAQMTHALWITGALWCDFLSWCPAFPRGLQTFYQRVESSEALRSPYAVKAVEFLKEIDAEVEAVKAMVPDGV